MAGIRLNQPNGVGVLNDAGASHPSPVEIDVDEICQLSFTGTTRRYRWVLTKPSGSVSVLSSTTSSGPSFMPDIDGGSYSISLFDDDEVEYILDIVTPTMGTGGGGGGGAVVTTLDTYDDLRAASFGTSTPQSVTLLRCRAEVNDGGGGMFAYDPDDATTADNDGTVLIDGDGHRFKRIYTGPVDVRWFGGGQGVAADDTAALQAACDLFATVDGTTSGAVLLPYVSGGYKLNAKLTVQGNPNQSIVIRGEVGPGAGPPGVTVGWYGADNTDTMVDFVGVNGLVVENIAFDANPVAGSDDTKGCKYAIWIRPDQDNSFGASDITFNKCQFKNARNISGAAQIALGPASGGLTQADNIRFRDCLILGRPDNTDYLADGVKNLAANNTKFFRFENTGINYCRYALNFALTSGPVSVSGCAINANHMAAFLTADARITATGCDGEGNNAICHYSGVGAATGNLHMVNCEWFNSPVNANPNGGSYDIQVDFPGEIRLDGGVYWNQRTLTISAATNASPIVCTTTSPHHLATGDRFTVFGATGNTAANGFWTVTVTDSTHFSLDGSTGNGSLSAACQGQPEMKFRTFAQDVATANGAFDAQGVTFYGCEGYPRAIDTTGADMFDQSYAQTEDVRASIRHCTGRSLNTDQPVLMPDIDMRAKRFGPVGSSAPISIVQRNHPWFADPTVWAIDEYGRVICNTAGGDAAHFSLELPQGCAFDSVTIYVLGGGNSNLPAVMPRFRVRTRRMDDDSVTATSASIDGSASAGAYNVVHTIAISSLGLTVDNETTRYTVEFVSESGANASSGFAILGVVCGATPAALDQSAA